MCTYRRTGCCPAFRARHGVLAVPPDVGARLAAIRDQEAQRKRDSAQGALGCLQRPGPLALRSRRRTRRRRVGDRRLIRDRVQACRHNCGRRRGYLPGRFNYLPGRFNAGIGLGARIGLSRGFGPGIIAAGWFDVAIAGWLGMVIIAELGEPVLHLRPAVFLQRAGVVLANRDPHIRSPFSRRASAVQLANPAPGQQRGETMDRAAAVPPGGPNSDRARLRAGRAL